jgi:MFS family permease
MLVVAQASILGFVVVFLHYEHGWPVAAAAAVLGAIQVAGAVMRVVAGRWSDHRDERVAPMRLMAVGSSLLLLAAAALTHASGAFLVPALLGAGVLAMSWNGLSFTAAAEMSGRARAGTAISVQNTVLSAGGALAPMAFAALVVATSWPVAWIALTAFQLGGVLVLGPSVLEERHRRALRQPRSAAHAPRQRATWHSKTAPTSHGAPQEAQ